MNNFRIKAFIACVALMSLLFYFTNLHNLTKGITNSKNDILDEKVETKIIKNDNNSKLVSEKIKLSDIEVKKFDDLYDSIKNSEKRIFSQNNEDGVIEKLIELAKIKDLGYYVEFGTGGCVECNSRNLRDNKKWTGLLMDGTRDIPKINQKKEIMLHSNILDLFQKYNVPKEFDLFSEDTDYADYWLVEKIMTKYTPKIVVHEINHMPPDQCVTVKKPEKLVMWDGSLYTGASTCAMRCLAKRFNYTMVYCETKFVNCFWLRNDLIENKLGIDVKKLQSYFTTEYLFRSPGWTKEYRLKRPVKHEWEYINC